MRLQEDNVTAVSVEAVPAASGDSRQALIASLAPILTYPEMTLNVEPTLLLSGFDVALSVTSSPPFTLSDYIGTNAKIPRRKNSPLPLQNVPCWNSA